MPAELSESSRNELIRAIDQDVPFLQALREDLKQGFPELDLDPSEILDRTRALVLGPDASNFKISFDSPSHRLRGAVHDPPAERSFLPADARTEGWFASLAFRLASAHPLLQALRADLNAELPTLDPNAALSEARKAARATSGERFPTEGPRLRLRDVSANAPAGSADHADQAVRDCMPATAQTEGWFASLAFRIGRVHVEADRLGKALPDFSRARDPKVPSERVRYLGFALKRLGTVKGGSEANFDLIQDAITKMLDSAKNYRCGHDFGSWFLVIHNSVIADWAKTRGEPLTFVEWADEEARSSPSPEPDEVVDPDDPYHDIRDDLWKLGIRQPSNELVKRWAEYLARCGAPKRTKGSDEVPHNLYELYVAYGAHADCRRQLAPSDTAYGPLSAIYRRIGRLIEYQERKDDGTATWQGGPDGSLGPVDELAQTQTLGWGLVAGRSEDDPVWNAARVLHWFSWKLKAAATLAVGLRHCGRLSDSSVQELAAVLRDLDCLRSFASKEQGPPRERLAPFVSRINALPRGETADSDASTLFLRTTVQRACLKAADRDAKRVDEGLPDEDWRWWLSRVTGRGGRRADALLREFVGRLGPGFSSPGGP